MICQKARFPVLAASIFAVSTNIVISEVLELDETVVVASRIEEGTSQTAGTSTAITNEEIQRIGATSLTDALKYEPGVSVPFDTAGSDGLVPYLAGGDSTVNIRGLEGNRVSINIDGIRQPEDFTARAFGNTGGPGRIYFDPATFSQIELYKTAASSLYGSDALGGVISGRSESALTMLGPELNGSSFNNSSTYSDVNESYHNRLAYAYGNGTTAYSILYSARLGHERQNNSSVQPANPADFDSHAIVTTLNWKPNDEIFLSFVSDYYRNDSSVELNSSEGSVGGGITNTDVSSDDTRKRLRFSLDFDHTPNVPPRLYDSFSAKAYWQDAKALTDNFQQRFDGDLVDRLNDLDYQTTITGITLQATKDLPYQTFTYGLDTSYSEVQADFIRTNTSLFLNPGSVETLDLIGMAPTDVIRAGLFARDEIRLGDREQFVITPAIRLDYYSTDPENTQPFLVQSDGTPAPDYENVSLSPSVSFLYNFTENLNAYVNWAQGTRNPTAEELGGVLTHSSDFINIPNPDLEEERSNSFEIGLQYNSDTLSSQLSGYYNLYDNFLEGGVEIQPASNGDPALQTTLNRAEATIYGIEFKTDWLVGEQFSCLQGLSCGGSLSWSDGNIKDGDNLDESPLNTIDPWKAVCYLAYNHPNEQFGTRLTATYVDDKSENDIRGVATPSNPNGIRPSDSYLAIDLTAYYQITEEIRIRGGITNLLDREYTTWATARRGQGHGFTDIDPSFFTSPGRSFFVAFDIAF